MRYSNLHNHTVYSDGKHTMEENIQSALRMNMRSLGFSDHSFTACDPSYCMKEEAYGPYLQEIAALKEKYADRLPIYAGLELDYYSDTDVSIFDYFLASVHYIIKDDFCHAIDHSPQQQQYCIDTAFGGDVIAMAECYYSMVCQHVKKWNPTFVGHFDLITKFSLIPEDDKRYQEIAREALKEVIKTCPYIEMNTGAISRGWRTTPYPGAYLLDTLKDAGGQVLLNADSHHIDNLTCFFDESVEILKQNGIDHICMFNGKTFDEVKI